VTAVNFVSNQFRTDKSCH